MKTITLLLSILLSATLNAQTYPFSEGFEGMPNTQVPAGWGGSMKVLQNHGIGDYKAICGRVSSAVTNDTAITPFIGPLTANSVLSFKYRIIDQANYPSTPTNLDTNDSVEFLISTDGVNYHTIFIIDENTHFATFNFLKKKVYLSQYADSTANFKIRCHYGTGTSFFVDIDTIRVADDLNTAVEEITGEENFTVYPNPCSVAAVCKLQYAGATAQPVKIFNCLGEEIFSIVSPASPSCILPLPPANFPPGLYFVQLGNVTRKLIIQ